MLNKYLKLTCLVLSLALLSGCATTENEHNKNSLAVNDSFLSGNDGANGQSDEANDEPKRGNTKVGITPLESLARNNVLFRTKELAKSFSDTILVNVSANNMALKDYIHYVYGQLLNANYLLSPELDAVNQPITLSLKEDISQRRLFVLSESVLADRGIRIKHNDGVYLISKVDPKSKASTVVGLGRTVDSIPNSNREILQVVPVLYGIKTSLRNTIQELADVSITIEVKQSALFIRGDYANVTRALELVQLLDSPANRGRYIGVVKLVYSSPDLYLEQISKLLETEGVPNGINQPGNDNLVFIPLPQIGAVAVFSATKELFERVEFWTRILDKPSEGDVKQYFVFHPKYARAQDIGDSLSPLISARTSTLSNNVTSAAKTNNSDKKGNTSGLLSSSKRQIGGSNGDLTFVVDQRSNALVFYTTGTEYRNIIPLVNRLDTLPKQVMLDIVVAEVTLTEQFKYGVKWAIENGSLGDVTGSASNFLFDGAFSYTYDNGRGESINASLAQEDSNVKILSNPNILVRDGVTASLDIGEDIAIVDSITEGFNDADRVTTSTSYRRTGISVSVTPTINAQGVVIMDITESISNEVTAQAGGDGGNPNVFERNLTTAVVAESGQTIILGGLIEERITKVENKVPLLGDIPLFGNLFKSTDDLTKKTELVLLVTPKVINRTEQWDGIKQSFQNKLSDIKVTTNQ